VLALRYCQAIQRALVALSNCKSIVAPLKFVQHDLLKSFATAQIPSIAIRPARANLVDFRADLFEALLVCMRHQQSDVGDRTISRCALFTYLASCARCSQSPMNQRLRWSFRTLSKNMHDFRE
jgi:hypothetical protein